MKIYINNPNENWICDRMRDEIMTYGGPIHFTENPAEAEVIWLLANWTWRQTPLDLLTSKRVVTTIHHIDPNKIDKQDYLERDKFTDAYHVPNEKTTKYFPKEINKNKIKTIPYWGNDKLWIPSSFSKEILRDKYSIPNNQLIVGSFQRDTEGFDLKTPKLSKGPDIFCEIVEKIKPKPHVVLCGWRRQYIISRLEAAGITYSYYEMANLQKISELYNCLDLYLVTSRHEGGPQALLECSLKKTPILSTNVGMANEVLSKECLMQGPEEFLDSVHSKTFDHSDENHRRVQKFKIENLFDEYMNFLKAA
jgi:hypothetical protein